MLIAGLNFLVGFASGLQLTLVSFLVVMLVALAADAFLIFSDISWLAAIGKLAIAAFCLQAGYVGGLLVRARAN